MKALENNKNSKSRRKQQEKQAMPWFEKRAKQGYAKSPLELGDYFYLGRRKSPL